MSLFKAYDLRGKVPEDLNEDIAYKIGRAYAALYQPGTVAVGYDIRNESIAITEALSRGLTESGTDVFNIGLCGTEEVYFATFHHKLDGGIMVTASHNPKGHNGMKLVGPEAKPISDDTGLQDIKALVESGNFPESNTVGTVTNSPDKQAYIEHLLSYINLNNLKPMKIVVDPGNGGAGIALKEIAPHLPFEFIYINEEPNGDFPNGVPNPLLLENQKATAEAVTTHGADLGLAWDGDFDRCFFFDADGRFIEGYYLVGLLAETILAKNPGGKIIHDPRLVWNTVEQTNQAGGKPVMSKCGHAFIKEIMREQDAIYGGEMSAHHYFREFSYCDSGMIPWLLITELMSVSGQTMKALVDERMSAYPCSGEINFRVDDAKKVIARILETYEPKAEEVDKTDGISMNFGNWRFNLRASNTEPLLRLNIETIGDSELLAEATEELKTLIQS